MPLIISTTGLAIMPVHLINDSEVEQALHNCATEAIHLIGSIQDHGVLLVLDAGFNIAYISNNTSIFLGYPTDYFSGKNIDQIHLLHPLLIAAKSQVKTTFLDQVYLGNSLFDVIISQNGEYKSIELIPNSEIPYQNNDLTKIINNLLSIDREKNQSTYFSLVAKYIQEISGFDHTMVYRFDSNWDGEVIAESCSNGSASYLGSRFPASDIPAQARLLYTKNRIRYVANVDATPVKILPASFCSKNPLDLTYIGLRSLSPIHIQYLKNMGVMASLSISLIQDQRLWGLITCHHKSPRILTSKLAETCELIGRVVSDRLNIDSALERYKLDEQVIHLFGRMSKFLWLPEQGIPSQILEELQEVMEADGVVLSLEYKQYCYGRVPDSIALKKLVSWLTTQQADGAFACDDLSIRFPPAVEYKDIVSGVLATPLKSCNGNFVIWFRSEFSRSVNWAGDPKKITVNDADGAVRLIPRNSFAEWTEMWPGRAKAWLQAQIITAQRLGSALLDQIEYIVSMEKNEQELTKVTAKLEHTQELMYSIIENIPVMVTLKNAADLRFDLFNPAGSDFLGFSEKDVIGKTDADLFPPDQAVKLINIDRQVLEEKRFVDLDAEEITTAHGEIKTLFTRKIAIRDKKGIATHLLSVSIDITEKRAAEQEIEQLAFYDPLTALPNRRLMLDRLKQVILSSVRNNKHAALILLDLDNFKILNDTHGHDAGDWLLREVANRLVSVVRKGDTVARLGGDEFVIILDGLDANEQQTAQDVKWIANAILQQFIAEFTIGPQSKNGADPSFMHRCSPSIGISLFHGTSLTSEEILKRADTAMYQAKNSGKNTYRFFDPEMQKAVLARLALEAELRKAVVHEEFFICFQPQVNNQCQCIGAEILLRWQHPDRGIIAPAEFIPLAEETGMILPIGFWVLEQACVQLSRWAHIPLLSHLTLAVNVSAKQFNFPSFEQEVKQLLNTYNVDPTKLKLELTESLLLEKTEVVIARMNAIKQQRVTFSLDDFGTGFSSLSYLKRLPLDQLKIDQSFIEEILTEPNDAAIAATIIALGKNLGLMVIAEGVETEEQKELLESAGCNAYQGYLFGRPIKIDEFEKSILSQSANK